jgi:hypothetical protein
VKKNVGRNPPVYATSVNKALRNAAYSRFKSRTEKITNLLTADFEVYKTVPHASLADLMFTLLVMKWTHEYQLPVFAKAFATEWGPEGLTGRMARATINAECPLRGGMASDNNALESTNNWDKNFFKRTRDTLPALLSSQKLVALVEQKSAEDQSFYGSMKEKAHSIKFYESVQEIMETRKT